MSIRSSQACAGLDIDFYAFDDWTSNVVKLQVLCGKPKPNKVNVVNRIIRGSDLTRTNAKGQTILFCAIKENMPLSFIKALLKYGADVTSRDVNGLTARDYAMTVFREDCVQCLDKHVFDTMRSRNITELNRYVMRSYGDIITNIVNGNSAEARSITHDLAEKRNMKPLADVMDRIPKLQVR